jgi:DNA polymerase-3 subunit delta
LKPRCRPGPLKPGYVLAGDEVFLLDRCRSAVLKAFVPPDLRDFCLSDLDLAGTSIFEVLDRAQTPSLMAPFQVIFVRNVRQLYTRGAKKDEFAALDRYFKSPNPQALLIFMADFLRIPSDARRMEMDDKNRFERLTETLGEHCGMVELARVNEEDAMRWTVSTAQESGSARGTRCGPRTGGCAGRGHDAGLVGAGKAAAIRLRPRPHHAGRRGDHGAGRQAALAL